MPKDKHIIAKIDDQGLRSIYACYLSLVKEKLSTVAMSPGAHLSITLVTFPAVDTPWATQIPAYYIFDFVYSQEPADVFYVRGKECPDIGLKQYGDIVNLALWCNINYLVIRFHSLIVCNVAGHVIE